MTDYGIRSGVMQVDAYLRGVVRKRVPGFRALLVTGKAADFPAPRDYAYTQLRNGVPVITVAPRMWEASPERIAGVLAHEYGHALLLLDGNTTHSERDADALAEQLFDVEIRYDTDDVQTIGPDGVRPRPAYLRR